MWKCMAGVAQKSNGLYKNIFRTILVKEKLNASLSLAFPFPCPIQLSGFSPS